MDGAMKFVKGDVIAGSFIIAVNLVAGTALGVLQRQLSADVALQRYGLLTIGDGLVSALLTATAAGMLVTRVEGEVRGATLGAELAQQLLGSREVLQSTAAFCVLLALVPGLPTLPFLALGLILGGLAYQRRPRPFASLAGPGALPATGWALCVSDEWAERRGRNGTDLHSSLQEVAQHARFRVFNELGVWLPPCGFATARLPAEAVLLSVQGVPARRFPWPRPTSPAELGDAVAAVLQRRAQDFLGLQETQARLDELGVTAPTSVAQVVPRLLPLPTLTEVLRRLVEESVSVADLKLILEALAQVAATEKEPYRLTEHVRAWLRRSITFELTAGAEQLDTVLLSPELENALRGAVRDSAAGPVLTLSPAASRDIVACIQTALSTCPAPLRARPVIVTRPDLRRVVRKLIERDLPDARVVTRGELLPETRVETRATAHLAGV
jgi:type III secretion protein V